MNETLYDYIKINFIHKELVEMLMDCSDDERPYMDYAFDVYKKIIGRWRGNDKIRINEEDDDK